MPDFNIDALDAKPLVIDFDKLQTEVREATRGNDLPAIGTSAGDLRGVSPVDPSIMRSPCAKLKWLDQNSPYHWETYVTMTYDGGTQGIIAYDEKGEVAYDISVPMTGGDDADPMKQIYINNKAIMAKAMEQVLASQ